MTQAAVLQSAGNTNGLTSRRGWGAALAALAVLLLGIWSLDAVQRWWAVVMIKTPAKLSKPLGQLPLGLGAFTRLGNVDRKLPPDQEAVLGTEFYLLRDYVESRDGGGTTGVSLNLNYYPVGTATPHVPRFCWAGAGMIEQGSKIFTVKDVRHKDGSTSDLRMQLLWFSGSKATTSALPMPEGATDGERFQNVAYMFQVNDGYVATAEEVTRHFWKPFAKYAYHTKIEVTVNRLCTPEEAQPVVERFIQASLAAIEECLPDAKKLASEARGQTGTEELGH